MDDNKYNDTDNNTDITQI